MILITILMIINLYIEDHFLNDIFKVNMGSEIDNYADDNHFYYEDKCYNVLKSGLGNDGISANA